MIYEAGEISKKRKIIVEKASYIFLLILTLVVIAFVLGIIIYLIIKGSSAINWEFLSQKPRAGMREGGIFPAILGTLYLVIGTFIFSLPIGILAAIYLNEYASKKQLTRV